MMKGSIKLGRWAGVQVSASWSTAIIAALITWTLGGVLLPSAVSDIHPITAWSFGVVGALLFFASLLAHELGHAVTARSAGIRTEEVTLWMFGGVAKLTAEARTPRDEMRIAAAGPAVSIGLAVGFFAAANLASVASAPTVIVVLATWMALMNVSLGVFNLLPGLPLDGGRILKAWRWQRTGDEYGAVRTAATGGKVVGGLLLGAGFFGFASGGSGLWTALIGFFIWQSAKAEEFAARVKQIMSALTVGQVTDAEVPVVPSHTTLDELAQRVMPRSGRGAVVLHDSSDRIVGVIDVNRMGTVHPSAWPLTPAHQVAWPAAHPEGAPLAHPNQALIDLTGGSGYHLVYADGKFMGLVTPEAVSRRVLSGTMARRTESTASFENRATPREGHRE